MHIYESPVLRYVPGHIYTLILRVVHALANIHTKVGIMMAIMA